MEKDAPPGTIIEKLKGLLLEKWGWRRGADCDEAAGRREGWRTQKKKKKTQPNPNTTTPQHCPAYRKRDGFCRE